MGQQTGAQPVAREEGAAVAANTAVIADPGEPEVEIKSTSAGSCAAASSLEETVRGEASTAVGLSFAGVPLTPGQAAARRTVGEERLRRAAEAGRQALLRKEGRAEGTPAIGPLHGPGAGRRVFVLIRGLPGESISGYCPFRWRGFRGYVCNDGEVEASCIFHGFASQAEAHEYWQAVHGAIPWPLLPPRT